MVRKINKEYIVKALQTKGQYISAWDNEGMKYNFFKTLNVYNDKKVNEINGVDLTGLLYVGIKVNQEGRIEKHIFNRLGFNIGVVCSKEVRRIDYIEENDLQKAILLAVEDKDVRGCISSEVKEAFPSIKEKIESFKTKTKQERNK